jgi:hypothetical protein
LIAASYRGGVAHPSGYPLYCLLGRYFSLFPFGEVAWRYNLFSALCGALTVGVVAAIIARLTKRAIWPAVGAALLLAGFALFGAQCVIAEVYALNALLVAAIFYCALAWRQEQRFAWLLTLALLLGLSFNSHLSIVFVWPGVLWLLAPLRGALDLRRMAALALMVLLGFSFTLYLPLSARAFPEPPTQVIAGREYSWFAPLDWGHPADFARWKTHVTVGQYDSLLWKPLDVEIGGRVLHLKQFAQTPQQIVHKFAQLCGLIALQFFWTTPLLLVGSFVAFKKQSRLGAALLLTCGLNLGVALLYDVDNVFDIANFLFPTYIVFALWMGCGIEWLVDATQRSGRLRALCHIALVGAVVCQWMLFVETKSFRGNTTARDLALERATAAEKLSKQSGRTPSLLLLNDDTLFPFWYVQKVLGHAPQVHTPWGMPVHAYQKQGELVKLVARLQSAGPVALAQWDEKVDRHFPYVALNESGTLWLASRRALPEPTQETSARARSHFVRPQMRRGETSGFLVNFDCPAYASSPPLALDTVHKTRQVGWIAVRVTQRGIKPLIQTRRLVLKNDAKAGTRLQVLLPLQLPIEAVPGEYEVEYRIVRTHSDNSTRWQRSTPVRVVVK